MRGTRRKKDRIKLDARFIPAHAGNTFGARALDRGQAVHPRACGEHRFLPPPPSPLAGSSPRMRGTQNTPQGNAALIGFIPAHAGNTPDGRLCLHARPVHPRACGEHQRPPQAAHGDAGSSPRMRGTRLKNLLRSLVMRFIPAHAGNTHLVAPMVHIRPVHPRACGEHRRDTFVGESRSGSSPRMRGTLLLQARESLEQFPQGFVHRFSDPKTPPCSGSLGRSVEGRLGSPQLADRWVFPWGEDPSSRLNPVSRS